MADTSKITLKQLKDAMNKAKNYTDNEIAGVTGVSKVEPEELDMPKVFFYGSALPTTKDNVNLTMDYISNTAKFSSFIKLKCQGTSSMGYAKKNFTVNMYSDEARTTKLKKDFKDWGNQSKFCLKANYVDTTHTRNISGARIAYDMVQSRPDSAFKQQLLTAPRYGVIDGFPIKLYFNGEFYGIYTWNIPKDGWMFNMDKSNPNHMVLCAEQNNNGSTANINVLRCEFREEWDGSDGASWSIEFGTLSDALKNSFNRCVNFVMTATDEEFKANIGEYFDLYSLLDYYCFSYLVAHIDGLAKNMLMATYDGVIWGACLYDMDSIYGADWDGVTFKDANIQCPEQYQETNSLLWQRIENCFSAELYARYRELRQGALSLSNIIKHVEEIYDVIPDRVLADEKAKWTSLPAVNTNTMTRFRNFMRDRAAYVDAQMLEIGTKVPCTGIVLSADTLSFTTTDTQTLSVVVSPDNCTDKVIWSVSPSGVATVVDGVVTPVTNGSCTITATCGSHSDTCSVTVALPDVVCTAISLDKTELALGKVSSDASNEVNLLDGAEWSNGVLNIDNGTVRANNSDKYTQINISTPGKYTLSSTAGYTYKKIALYDTNGAFMCGVGNEEITNNCIINVTKPCVAKIGAYPNGIAWDGSALSLTRSKINENITNSDTTYTLTSSDINVRYTGSNYVYAEVFLDKKYDDMVILEFDGNIYGTVKKITGINNETALNVLATSKNLGYINNYEYYDKTFLNVAFPIAYGTTAADILSNMTSTTVTVNPTDELAKIEASATTQILSAQLTATVAPTNCTQPVVWSVSPEGIVTVNNGLVRAVTNGEATVTATCGTQSANCAVTVSGMIGETEIYATAEYAITEPRTFNGTSDYIDTGIQLFDTAKDFTLFIDYTPTAEATQSNQATVFHCIHEVSPWRGLCLMIQSGTTQPYIIGGQASGNNAYLDSIGDGNHKFIIQFANGVISSIKTINDGVVEVVTIGSTAANSPYVQVTENLLLGCYQDTSGTKGRYWNGTINKFAVWFKQLTYEEIQQVFDAEYVPSVSTTYTNGYIARQSSHTTDGTTLGAIKESNSDITTDFISCTSNDVFNILAPITTYGSGVVAYDSDKNYISTYLGNGVWELGTTSSSCEIKATRYTINNIPENTNYIRLCFNTTDSALITIMQSHGSANLLEGISWSANADNGIYSNISQGTPGEEKGAGNGDAYLSGQIPCSKKKYVLSNINGATFLYKEMYVYASDGTFLGGSYGTGKYNTDGDSDASGGDVTMDLRNIDDEPAYMRITAFPNHIASNNNPATQLKLISFN